MQLGFLYKMKNYECEEAGPRAAGRGVSLCMRVKGDEREEAVPREAVVSA